MSVLIKPGIGAVRNPDGTYQSVDGFSPDITQLKEEIANKLTKPSTVEVGKYFRVASIDSDGNPVLETVNLPTLADSTYGLPSVNYEYGVYKMSDGTLRTYAASHDAIDKKEELFQPIVPDRIDRAVRAGLISNSQITDADKANICQTIGAAYNGNWVDLDEITLTEAVRSYLIDLAQYNFIEVTGSIDIPPSSTTATLSATANGVITCLYGYNTIGSSSWRNIAFDVWVNGGRLQAIWKNHEVSEASMSGIVTTGSSLIAAENATASIVNGIRINCNISDIPSGTKIRLRGRS